ncbi:MAG: hypothetical protein ACFFDF_19550 [Candidatus Odinarchaeota archaeon]
MVKKIEKIGRIIKIGNSKGIIIEKDVLEYLNLDIGDAVKLLIEKLENIEPRKVVSSKGEKK